MSGSGSRSWKRGALSQLERDAYLASRAAGDANAATRGPGALAARVAKRTARRDAYRANPVLGGLVSAFLRGGRR